MPPIMHRSLIEALVQAQPSGTKLPATLKEAKEKLRLTPDDFSDFVRDTLEQAVFSIVDAVGSVQAGIIMEVCVCVCARVCVCVYMSSRVC